MFYTYLCTIKYFASSISPLECTLNAVLLIVEVVLCRKSSLQLELEQVKKEMDTQTKSSQREVGTVVCVCMSALRVIGCT